MEPYFQYRIQGLSYFPYMEFLLMELPSLPIRVHLGHENSDKGISKI